MKSDQVLIDHILESATKILRFIKGLPFEHFTRSDNEIVVSAVIKELIVVGEAVNNLSEEFRESNPGIPFYDIIGMRNRIIHEYWDVDDEVVWKTCTEDIPKLKKQLEEVTG